MEMLLPGGRVMAKDNDNPMSKAHAAPRCTAKSKRTGERCKGPAVRGWTVCRFHGAGGGSPRGEAHPAYKHGMRSHVWVETRRGVIELIREARETEALIND